MPKVPLTLSEFPPIIEHTPVNPINDPQVKEFTIKELAKLMSIDLGAIFEEGVIVIVKV
jgi:hypothetical protein